MLLSNPNSRFLLASSKSLLSSSYRKNKLHSFKITLCENDYDNMFHKRLVSAKINYVMTTNFRTSGVDQSFSLKNKTKDRNYNKHSQLLPVSVVL